MFYPLLIIPTLPLLGFLVAFSSHSNIKLAVSSTTTLSLCTFFTVILFAFFLSLNSNPEFIFLKTPSFTLNVLFIFDRLTIIMLLLITFMSMMIHFYSARYLISDAMQARFMSQLSLVTFSLIIFVMSGNLLTAFIGWEWIGLSLYLLLNHYHFDLNANKAAKKKFIINRVGDMCFLTAVILAYQYYGTSDFQTLFSSPTIHFIWLAHALSIKAIILSLVFVAVMTKSAQFPFHIWLPDTMETPTPVSALMHAGIINSGGFLLTRLSPLAIDYPLIMHGIFVIGFITLIMGSFFMLTQTDIKKQLAYSTMGQMGYMILQCGLGFFPAAIFHLIVHGFFKASLLLNAGSALKALSISQSNIAHSFQQKLFYAFCTLSLTFLIMHIGLDILAFFTHHLVLPVLIQTFLMMTMAQTIWQTLIHKYPPRFFIYIISMLTLLLTTYLFFTAGFKTLLFSVIQSKTSSIISAWEYSLTFLLLFLQFLSWFIPFSKLKTKTFQKLYLISFNKAYVEQFYRRYMLEPCRRTGDYFNDLLFRSSSRLLFQPPTLIALFMIIFCGYSIHAWIQGKLNQNILIIFIDLLLFIMLLLMANRTKTLKQLFVLIVGFEFTFVNMGLSLTQEGMPPAAIFHLINVVVLLLVLFFLLIEHRKPTPFINIELNTLPWLSIYLSIVLLLLIGVPGTASFISDFFIINALLQVSSFLALMMGFAIILMAIVVLHLLQLYVFSPAKFSRQNPRLSPLAHMVCLICIMMNIANGIYPKFLFFLINQMKGV